MSPKAQQRLVVVCSILLAAPVLLFAYPPMTDLPHHEALVALLRHFGDTSLYPPGLYERNFGQPNQLFHLVAWPLSYALGVTFACKLVTAGAVAAVPLAGARLARHLGAAPLAALTLVPVATGWLFTWGFVNNLMALAILFALVPLIDELSSSPTPRRVLAACGGALLLYLAHELVMFVYVGGVVLFAMLRASSVRRFALATVPAAFALAVAAAQIRLQEHLKTATVRMVPNVWLPLKTKLAEVPGSLIGGVDQAPRLAIFGLTVGFIVLLAVARRRNERATPAAGANGEAQGIADAETEIDAVKGDPPTWRSLRDKLERLRVEVWAAATFGLYLVAPFTFNGAMLVHERFLAPAFGLAAIAAGRGVAPKIPAVAFGGALPFAALFVVLPWFGDSSRNFHDMETLFDSIPLDSSVAAVDLDRNQGGRPFTVASGLSRVLVRRGGRVLYSFAESTVAPVRLTREHQWDEPSARIMFDNSKFRPKHDLTRFRFLLVHSSDAGRFLVVAVALDAEARLVAVAGEWALFESKLEVVPLTAPDVQLPEPHPETLGRRLWLLEHAQPAPPVLPP